MTWRTLTFLSSKHYLTNEFTVYISIYLVNFIAFQLRDVKQNVLLLSIYQYYFTCPLTAQ